MRIHRNFALELQTSPLFNSFNIYIQFVLLTVRFDKGKLLTTADKIRRPGRYSVQKMVLNKWVKIRGQMHCV